MRRLAPLLVVALLLAACGSSHATPPKASATHVAQVPSTPAPKATRASVHPAATTAPAVAPTPAPTASAGYTGFLASMCHAFSASDAATITNDLPYYQYNSGVRYGSLGDGEGQTGDPSILGTWLQGANVRCQFYTPDEAGHGTLLTSGWNQPGGWSLIEVDTFNGAWKINDFTFGDRAALYHAMQTSQPILTYHGR